METRPISPSLPHLIELLDGLGKEGAGFQSLSESIDTTTAGCRLVFHMMEALRVGARIDPGTHADGRASRQREVSSIGRQKGLDADQLNHARSLSASDKGKGTVATLLGVDASTLRRSLRN